MNKAFFILLLIVSNFCSAQNLVPNSSFEDTVYCPLGSNNPQALDTWFNPTMASPDYYNACASNGGGVPVNDWGYQEAEDGNAYIGIATFGEHPSVANYREYMEVELFDSLTLGKTYHWCMYVSLLDSTNFAANNIGISLTVNPIFSLASEEMLIATIYGNNDEIILDNVNWTLISGSFIANGGEKFLTIGNFKIDEATDYIEVMSSSLNGDISYYYIDNVYVGIEPCAELVVEMPNVFTPNNDGVNDILTFSIIQGVFDYSISILDRWGNRIYNGENEFNWNGTTQHGDVVTDGTYFYILEYNKKEVKKGFVQVVR